MFHDITREERTAPKEIKTWENCCARVQDNRWRFVILLNEDLFESKYPDRMRLFYDSA